MGKTAAAHGTTAPVTFDNFTVTYSSGVIYLYGINNLSKMRVLDTKGKVVAMADGGQSSILFSNKSRGVYIVDASVKDKSFSSTIVIP